MERPVGEQSAPSAGRRPVGGDFAGYVARNVPTAYRFAAMALGSPVTAQDAVHDAVMAAWQAGGQWPQGALDGAFGRRLVGQCRTALRSPAAFLLGPGDVDEPLEAALREMDPNEQLVLAERFGMPGEIETVATTLRGRGSLDKRLPAILKLLAVRMTALAANEAGAGRQARPGALDPATLGDRLRVVYAARDPGEDPPSQLRWRLQRSLIEAEQAAAEQAEIAATSGWGFAVKTIGVLVIIVLAITVASVVRLRDDAAAAASPGAGPASPLAISTVQLLEGDIDSPSVHVAATGSSMLASYQTVTTYRVSPRECLADVVGVVQPNGSGVQWLGQLTGHVDAIAGNPAGSDAFVSGTGPYCAAASYASADGGQSWSNGGLPMPNAAPSWLAYDPSRPGWLVARVGNGLHVSSDAGRSWQARAVGTVPLGFNADGRLVGWQPGRLVDSIDDGVTWLQIGAGPVHAPQEAAALRNGVLLEVDGALWWYPIDGQPEVVRSGPVFSIAGLGGGAVVLGADDLGHPWITTVNDGIAATAALPSTLAGLTITGGEVAANADGAVFALIGPKSSIAYATFVR